MQYKQLSIEERELIQQGLWANKSLRDIAKEMNRNPGSISRELKRNSSLEKHCCYVILLGVKEKYPFFYCRSMGNHAQ